MNDQICRVFAIVPAAGQSRRMGVQKLGLPLGDKTVLEHVAWRLADCHLSSVLIVLGPSTSSLATKLPQEVHALILDTATAEMRETIEHGIQWLREHHAPRPTDALLLAPADHPALRPEVVCRLVADFRRVPERICVPVVAGRRGHPVLLPWALVSDMRDIPPDRGFNELLVRNPGRIHEIDFPFADLTEDIDYPEDYDRQRRDFEK